MWGMRCALGTMSRMRCSISSQRRGEADEGARPRLPGEKGMEGNAIALRVLGEELADFLQVVPRNRHVEEAQHRAPHEADPCPDDMYAHGDGDQRIENQP